MSGTVLSAVKDYSVLSFTPTKHSDSKTHKATEWQGKKVIQVNDYPLPLLTDEVKIEWSCSSVTTALLKVYVWLQHDVMLKVTATAICGSDLHLYLNAMPGKYMA